MVSAGPVVSPQPSRHAEAAAASWPASRAPDDVQQASPRRASSPSRAAKAAITRAASGSAHHQPSAEFATSPTSSTPDRYEHSNVCSESATTLGEPSSRPVRRSSQDSTGITTTETAARAMPTPEWSAASALASDRTASTVT